MKLSKSYVDEVDSSIVIEKLILLFLLLSC
jgi:hypothetical protein